MSSPRDDEAEIRQLGPYRLTRQLGHGGMGIVHEGVNVETGESAAVKILSASLAGEEGFRHRFETEIETLRKLRHPNIVRLFGFGEQDAVLFYAMELVDGKSLDQVLRSGYRFHWPEAAEIGIAMCGALRHAHDRGIIHRDIKPANLLLTADGTLKLSDFGIAKLFGQSRTTAVGSVLGTIDYMAPEQADGRPAGPKSDLYSLGGVLYTLLAGRAPFTARSLPEMLEKHRSAVPDPVGRYCPDVPPEFEAAISQLLEKSPRKRIANATILGRILQTMLDLRSSTDETLIVKPDEEQDGFDLRSGETELTEPHPKEQPETRTQPKMVELPVTQVDPILPQDSLDQTKFTSAFDALSQADSDSKDEGGPPIAEKPRSRFTHVGEHELDQPDVDEPQDRALISLQTWALAAGLIGVGLMIWYVLRPPDADTLYRNITDVTARGSIDSYRDAKNDIEDFLVLYGSDYRAELLRRHLAEIELDGLESKLERRAARDIGLDELLPVQRDYVEAIKYVRLNPELGMVKLAAFFNLYSNQTDASAPVDTSSPTGQCLELARRRLRQLERDISQSSADHLPLIQSRLDRADSIADADPDAARLIREAVVELYGQKPWAEEAVSRAQEALDAKAPRKSEPN